MLAGALAGAALGLALNRRFDRYRIHGPSMEPALRPGDRVFVDASSYRRALPRPGDVVVAPIPGAAETMVKRVWAVLSDGRVDLRGDNPAASTDSRQLGLVPAVSLRGKVLFRYWPRPGRLRPAAEP